MFFDQMRLAFQQAPKYLGVRLDRMLNYKKHLEEVAGKVTSRASLIRRIAGTTWGASAKSLRISTQALVFSAPEYCAPVWSRIPHGKKVNFLRSPSKKAIRIITSSNFLAHSEPIFKQLHLLKSYDIYKCQLLKFLF